MKKLAKNIGKMVLYMFLAFVVFLTCCYIDNYVDNRQRGYDEATARKYTERRIEELYINPVNEWLESISPKRKEVMEFPICNWNITWNTLNKKDP